jgi:uncharacterized cupredoxin-like copper-binding protein
VRVGCVLALVLVMGAGLGARAPIPPASASSRSGQSLVVTMGEYWFRPARLALRAGSTVTLRLANQGVLAHELMVGRGVVREASGKPDRYREDFFAGLRVEVLSAVRVKRATPGKARPVGPLAEKLFMHEGMEMEHPFMVDLEPRGTAVLRFTVPGGRVGSWEMGCFEQDGAHYLAGMKGVVSVTP